MWICDLDILTPHKRVEMVFKVVKKHLYLVEDFLFWFVEKY